jgi:hypothetical protein
MTAIDAAAKSRVRDALLAAARAELAATERHLADERAAAELAPDEPTAAYDVSQSDEAGDLHGLFDRTAEEQRASIEAIEALDFSPATMVRPGVLVGFGGDRYVVGVVASAFEVDGATYEGISPDSPAYAVLKGLADGEKFELNGRSQTVDFVA